MQGAIQVLGFTFTFTSAYLSCGSHLKDKKEGYQNCSVLYCMSLYPITNKLTWAIPVDELGPVSLALQLYSGLLYAYVVCCSFLFLSVISYCFLAHIFF